MNLFYVVNTSGKVTFFLLFSLPLSYSKLNSSTYSLLFIRTKDTIEILTKKIIRKENGIRGTRYEIKDENYPSYGDDSLIGIILLVLERVLLVIILLCFSYVDTKDNTKG